MRNIYLIIIFLYFTLSSFAQPYGNEWIDYSQTYLKFKVVNSGVYKITYNDLNNVSGFNINNVQMDQIQIWGRGQQIPIHIEDGSTSNEFDLNDFIEFYAQSNDGWLDTLLYHGTKNQVNPYYSLYNDTATYYLTFSNSSNLRYTGVTAGSITTPEPYFFGESIEYNPQQHWQGEYSNVGAKHDNDYTSGEGWFFNAHSGGTSKTISVATPGVYTSGPNATVISSFAGVNNPTGIDDHDVYMTYNSNSTSVFNVAFSDFEMYKPSFNIPANQLTSSTNIVFNSGPTSDPNSKVAVGFVSIKYPRTYSSVTDSAIMLTIPQKATTNQIRLSNFSNPFNKAFVYDFENITRTTINSSNVEFTLPSGNEREIFIFSNISQNFQSPIGLKLINGNGKFHNYSSSLSENAFVIVSSRIYEDEAIQYGAYRSSINGGSHDTLIAYVEELYDQFAYGVMKHPISIRNFAQYLSDNLPSKPKHLFLVGKSINYVTSRKNPVIYAQNHVPTYGYPSSDNGFTAGLSGTTYEMDIPTGRLAAISPQDITNYLVKVQELETNQQDTLTDAIQDKMWMKHVIHFGGGAQVSQQNLFASYLLDYEAIIKDTLFGAYVDTFYKNTSQIIQPSQSTDIESWIEEGASIITFFGHSSAQGFDVSLDDPEAYDNKGKYPIFFAFGCQSGDIHGYIQDITQPTTASEDFVLTPDHGAICFIASTHSGLANEMDEYAEECYKHISYLNYDESIGEIIKQTVKDYQDTSTCNGSGVCMNKATCFEMSIHGDPSIKINPHRLPDYAIEPTSITFSPEVVSTDLSSFTININVINLGRAINDSVPITVVRKVNGEIVETLNEIMPPIYFNYVHQIEFSTSQANGLNTFDIMIDPQNDIEEIHTTNNNLLTNNAPSVYITSSDLIPIFPYNYAVVERSNITLKASTADVFAPNRTYKIQIDYKDTYDSQSGSPLDETTITQSGGVVSWTPDLGNVSDSTVFYWRCAPWPIGPNDGWREHSFQYINGKTGWGQDDFFQFKNDEYYVINHKRDLEKFEFDTLRKSLSCQTVSNASNISEYNNTFYQVDGITYKRGICNASPAIYVVVIDSLTLTPWDETQFDFGSYYENLNCWSGQGSPIRTFAFLSTSATQIDAMVNMITDSVPDGHYLLMYTAVTGNFENTTVWQNSDFLAIEQLGANLLSSAGNLDSSVDNDSPYILFTKKGTNVVQEVIGQPDETISLTGVELFSVLQNGYIESTVIGPAYEWGELSWKQSADEVGQVDSVNIYIYRTSPSGSDSLLVSFLDQNTGNIPNLNTIVDAQNYPYLKLRTEIHDRGLSSSGQLDRWHLLYEGIPEAALDPHTEFTFVDDTLQEGQNLELTIAIENVSHYDMDSLRVSYWIESNNSIIPVNYPTQSPLLAGNILSDKIDVTSTGVSQGYNKLWIEVNPEDSLWQLEQYHFNNIAYKTFYVEKDITNPILDVTFDGIHILDGDIVSPEPSIVMELNDENPYIAIDEATNFEVYITDPEGVQTVIPVENNSQVLFTPAELPENKARIEFTPKFEQDGIYRLDVQGIDGSENKSGDFSYSISFEVISASTITQIINYPNPFSTSTRFVFILTGSKIPDEIKIQILTVSGKVVREITQDEIGPVHIGRNVSEYAWDGTDEFGDPLANGVYVYKVITKIGGQSIEHRDSDADEFFHKGFGKMYLMR